MGSGGGGAAGDALEELADHGFGLGADEFVDDLTVAEGFDGGNAADVILHGDGLVVIGVEPGEDEVAVGFFGQALEDGAEHAAWAAPGGPEVDDDGDVARAGDDFGLEVAVIDVDYGTHSCLTG